MSIKIDDGVTGSNKEITYLDYDQVYVDQEDERSKVLDWFLDLRNSFYRWLVFWWPL